MLEASAWCERGSWNRGWPAAISRIYRPRPGHDGVEICAPFYCPFSECMENGGSRLGRQLLFSVECVHCTVHLDPRVNGLVLHSAVHWGLRSNIFSTGCVIPSPRQLRPSLDTGASLTQPVFQSKIYTPPTKRWILGCVNSTLRPGVPNKDVAGTIFLRRCQSFCLSSVHLIPSVDSCLP